MDAARRLEDNMAEEFAPVDARPARRRCRVCSSARYGEGSEQQGHPDHEGDKRRLGIPVSAPMQGEGKATRGDAEHQQLGFDGLAGTVGETQARDQIASIARMRGRGTRRRRRDPLSIIRITRPRWPR